MLLKNLKILKPLILFFVLLSSLGIIFNYKIQRFQSLENFKEYILKKNFEYEVVIKNNKIIISGYNSQKIIKSLLQLNVSLELIIEKNGFVYIVCSPEGLMPKFISLNNNLNTINPVSSACVVNYG